MQFIRLRSRTGSWLLFLNASVACFAQTDSTFDATSRLVTVDVAVRQGPTGPFLANLRRDDFVLRDEDNARPISHFEVGDLRLDIVLVVDVNGPRVQSGPIRHAIDALLAALNERDLVRVIRLDKKGTDISASLTRAEDIRREIAAASHEQTQHGMTVLYRGVEEEARLSDFAPTAGLRPVILAITHNQDKPGTAQADRAREALLRSDAAFCAIVVPMTGSKVVPVRSPLPLPVPPRSPLPIPRPTTTTKQTSPDLHSADLRAEATGGDVARPEDGDQSVASLFQRLRNRYVLSFAPEANEESKLFHRITVELTPSVRLRYPNAIVSHRVGYYFR